MTYKQLAYVLFLGTASLTLEGMKGPGKPHKDIGFFKPNETRLEDTTPLFAELSALDQLKGKKNVPLQEVYVFFKGISTNKLPIDIQAQIQILRNFVFTIVSDKELSKAFVKSKLSNTFTKDLFGLAHKIVQSNHGKKGLVEGTDTDTAALIAQAIKFIEDYSKDLVTKVEHAFDGYKAACDSRPSPEILKKANRTLAAANAFINNAQARFDKDSASFNQLRHIAKQENEAKNFEPKRRWQINENANQAHEKKDASWKKLGAAKTGLEAAKAALCVASQMEHTAQVTCEKTLRNLKKALGAFESKTSKLLNIRACTRTTSFGILCPAELLLAIFDTLEEDQRVIVLVGECRKAYKQQEQLMKEFLLTLQHYVCNRYSLSADSIKSAKGFCWEMGVGLCLFDNTASERLETFGTHLTDNAEDKFREVDATTEKCIIECKNISWADIDFNNPNKRAKKLMSQLKAQAKIAEKARKQYVLVSREKVPERIGTWLIENRIKICFIDPTNQDYTLLKNVETLYTARYCVDLVE